MNFLVPWAWAWLASGLAVVLLHLLRRREREHPVSALFLWEPIPPDRVSRIQRMLARADLLLLFQLLAVLLLAGGLAHPVVRVVRPAGATAIVLDGSASMGIGGRPAEALEAVRKVVRDSAGPWAVVLWADPPGLLVPPTDRREEALALLGNYRPTLGSRPPLGQALALLPGGFGRIVVVTDDPPAEGGVEVVPLPPRDNLAIVSFSVRTLPDSTGYEALVRVRNDTRRYQDVQVALEAGAGTYLSSRLLGPGEEDLFTFSPGLVRPGLRAELLPRDEFPWDNVRYFALEGAAAVRVRWLGEEDRYLWAALQAAFPVERVTSGSWDLTVAVRTELPSPPAGPALLLAASSPEARLGEPVPAGPFRGADAPLLRHVVPDAFRAASVFPTALPAGAVVDLWAGEVPVLARWEGADGRRALLALDLARSNLPLLPDFPILLRALLAWLLPFRPRPTRVVGESAELPPGTEVLTPQGPVQGVWVPDRPGLYELRGERVEVVAVNVPYEESLPPRSGPAGGGPGPVAAAAELAGWPWFALGAFVLLGLEWALARRRGL
ncbi:MAG: VWA domain-containing protein [Candidatus Bipolaricaulota bacterium]|nr:VWA domain-containing protein [Candidatus Bipolaricaulota bacterium]